MHGRSHKGGQARLDGRCWDGSRLEPGLRLRCTFAAVGSVAQILAVDADRAIGPRASI